MKYLLLFHCNNGCNNLSTLPVFFKTVVRLTLKIFLKGLNSARCSQRYLKCGQLHATSISKSKRWNTPVTSRAGPEGSRKLRLLDFLTTAQQGGRLSALRTGRLYPQGYSWYSFSLGLSRPQGHGSVGRKWVTEKSSDTTGNRSRGLPTSSAAP